VRDEGCGFDPPAVSGDRRGLRDSVTRRLSAHGGSVQITSEAGAGAEIELSLPLGGTP
jgi:signal transduction histidine kinase